MTLNTAIITVDAMAKGNNQGVQFHSRVVYDNLIGDCLRAIKNIQVNYYAGYDAILCHWSGYQGITPEQIHCIWKQSITLLKVCSVEFD